MLIFYQRKPYTLIWYLIYHICWSMIKCRVRITVHKAASCTLHFVIYMNWLLLISKAVIIEILWLMLSSSTLLNHLDPLIIGKKHQHPRTYITLMIIRLVKLRRMSVVMTNSNWHFLLTASKSSGRRCNYQLGQFCDWLLTSLRIIHSSWLILN